MRTPIIVLCILLFAVKVFGQQQTEINNHVWKPFIESFNNHDAAAFMAVHSKDVVRSPRDSKAVWNWTQYLEQQTKSDKRETGQKLKRDLELRFTERLANADQAIEVGIYKTTYIQPNGTKQSYYGRFHVVLSKESGQWKILVDTDSTEGNTITEEDFNAATKMK